MSDLHFGARNGLDDPALEREIGSLVGDLSPELVVASGDLTHRSRPAEHDVAERYLRGLARPLLVVPGNHDIPPWPPRRLVRPFEEFQRHWGSEPAFYSSPTLCVSGLNSVNPWGYQRGRLRRAELTRVARDLAAAEPGALRVVVLHHQLAGSPWRWRKLPLAARSRALRQLSDAGAQLVLGGHIHQGSVSARSEFEVLEAGAGDCVLVTAPGLGRPRPGRSYEVRGIVVLRVDEGEFTIETHIWRADALELAGARAFPR